MESHVKSTHRMGTPIHGEVDPTVKKQPCPSKHYAHTTKRASMHNQKSIVFLWVPYRFCRFHATANIRCTLQCILNQRKFWRNLIYADNWQLVARRPWQTHQASSSWSLWSASLGPGNPSRVKRLDGIQLGWLDERLQKKHGLIGKKRYEPN